MLCCDGAYVDIAGMLASGLKIKPGLSTINAGMLPTSPTSDSKTSEKSYPIL
jgi:hypothetical protein